MATIKPQITTDDIWAKTAAAADKAKPAQTKVNAGWAFGEMPPFQIFNWFKNIYSQMFVHIQEYGIPEWSADIEYQKGALTMHAGEVWKAKDINKNKQPGTAPDWSKPFDIQLPIGSVIAYRGLVANIPAGWSIVTDLNDRFIIGTSVVGDVGNTGGSSDSSLPEHSHTTTTNTVPSHVHTANHNHTGGVGSVADHKHTASHNHAATFKGTTLPNHDHSMNIKIGNGGASGLVHTNTAGSASSIRSGAASGGTPSGTVSVATKTFSTGNKGGHTHTLSINTRTFNTGTSGAHTHTVTIAKAGVAASGKNLPPYKKLMYIERIS